MEENRIQVFILSDDQFGGLVYTNIEDALEHIRQGMLNGDLNKDDSFTITVDYLTQTEIDALPEC